MNNFFKLTPENFKEFMPFDIVALHFGDPGACGGHGLNFITSDKRLFSLDYMWDGWTKEDKLIVCPIMGEIRFDPSVGYIRPQGWKRYNLGLGNCMFIKEEVSSMIPILEHMTPPERYKHWAALVIDVLGDIQ